ncbi:protein CURVATURE THYLAKOID 1D, chloroplastic-like [Hibiscus syriacus]|uniref:protein CURVATURE THYLAKOID 1D, chloroplastic-like n=1 Tax=Hibiscus syriacus TaxID=106335 RepID=UPI00192460DF|nr:protein CURVATURE THYLAKOID 1D, chloroplastic-like [Hibiscus syriacus]
MELLATTPIRSISTLPSITFSTLTPSVRRRLCPPPLSGSTSIRLRSRVLTFSNPLPKATASDEASSTGPNRVFGEDRDGVASLEEVSAVEKNVVNENLSPEEPKVNSASDEESQMFEFWRSLNLQLEKEDAYSIILYGSGALVALWLASALVGAIDSIPLFPKLLEVVGLGYAIWFTSRYLIFKKNREELATKVEQLKQQILGSD